ncbi:MAG TPA: helix-turn-helix domain-containing protein [Candidatus Binataceae bacterium]|nr:helix-turn-helix domain-containing protein [Candidatus Binataceae bacterium]
MAKRILTVSELADHLSVHRITIYRLLKSGSIPGFKIGRVWRFELDQISSWMTTGVPPLELTSAPEETRAARAPVREHSAEPARGARARKPMRGN